MAASTPHTLIDALSLATAIHRIRELGWAAAPNEALIGLNAVAAPVLNALGQFAGSVAVVDSIQYIPETPSPALVEGVKAAARRISADLGYRPRAASSG